MLASAVLLLPATSRTQVTLPCDPGVSPPGTSGSGDISRSFCSLTRRPLPIETSLPATLPHWMGYANVHAMLVVDSYGTVDRGLTRPWSMSFGAFGVRGYNMNDSLMAGLARFRFTPGFAHDTAVRSALGIDLITHGAPDSLPATSRWRYVLGSRGGDTLFLDWTPMEALPVAAPGDIAMAIAVALGELRVTPLEFTYMERQAIPWTGCSIVGSAIPEARAVEAIVRKMGVPLAGEGQCESFDGRHAVTWTHIFRIAPSAYTIRFIAPMGRAGKCRVERRDGAWIAACG